MYAEYATSEPAIDRYAIAAAVRGVNDSAAQSPCTVAADSSITPLNTICNAEDGNGSSPSSCRLAYDVPATQPTHANWIAITPPTNARPLAPPCDISGHTRMTMPEKPMVRPTDERTEKRSPLGSRRSSSADQNGVVAISTAVRPLATYCCAYTTRPLPMMFIRTPSRTSAPHMRMGGRRLPFASRMPHSSTPAAIQRRPATNSTGTVSSATVIAR